MDWKLFVASFVAIFLAELGDKTQLSVLCLASSNTKGWLSVLLGGAIALCLSTAIAVGVGCVLGKEIPQNVIRIIAGCVFIIFGMLMLFNKL
jgi:Ca2+/H+ antiporter, TMEM165/GDT1 family